MRKIVLALLIALYASPAVASETIPLDFGFCFDSKPTSHHALSDYKGEIPKPSENLKKYMSNKQCVLAVQLDFDEFFGSSIGFEWSCLEPCGWKEVGSLWTSPKETAN